MASPENRYAPLFEHADNAIALLEFEDEIPIIAEANTTFCRLFAADDEDLTGARIDDTIASGQRKADVRAAGQKVKRGELASGEVTRDTVDGPRRFEWELVPLLTDSSGDHERGFVIYRDITERTERESKLQRLQELTEYALEETNTTVWTWDPDAGESDTLYQSLEALIGAENGTIEGVEQFMANAVHPDDRSAVLTAYEDVMEGQSDHLNVEFRTHPDTDYNRWLWTHGYLREDLDPPLLVGLMTDVTDQKQRELERQRERLDEFSSVISHDLRNPLNVAVGRVDLARTTERDQEQHLAIAQRALNQMDELITKLYALARHGRSIGEQEVVELGDLIERSWESVATGESRLQIQSSARIVADSGRLLQLTGNLFRNAVEHSGADLTVTVGTMNQGFFIEDNGSGIAEADRSRVFDAGFTTSAEGTGFGLSIVREIANAHDWEVHITDSKQGGARFEFAGVTMA